MDTSLNKIRTNILQSTYGTFSKIDSIFGYQTSLNKLEKTELLQSFFSDQNVIKIKIKKKEKWKIPNMWKLNNTFLKQSSQKWNHKGNYKIFWDKQKQKHNMPKLKECSKSDDYTLMLILKNKEDCKWIT